MTQLFKTISLADENATLTLGAEIAACLQAGDFIALRGPLGAGKTTLSRGLIQTFVGEELDVPSPTFTLVQNYTRARPTGKTALVTDEPLDLYHFDLYRLKNSEEVWELGWEDLASAVALVEWPDNAGEYLPDHRLTVVLSFENGGRTAQFFASDVTRWKERLYGV